MEGSNSIYTEKTADELIAFVKSAPTSWQREAAMRMIFSWPGIERLPLLPRLIDEEFLVECVLQSNNPKLLRTMLNLGLRPQIGGMCCPGMACSKILVDYDAKLRKRIYGNTETHVILAKFQASRIRARLGAIAVISAISRRRSAAAAATKAALPKEGVNPYSKDVALIIARVVWESRGFYSLVSRRHFARRK